MKIKAKRNLITKTHLEVVQIVDGDGLIAKNKLTNEQFEIRLLGIDAPELKKCPKLLQDERETHLPGALQMQLGFMSFKYMLEKVPVGSNITMQQEPNSLMDPYGRQLAYVILNDGSCINQTMVENGFAKPYNKFHCEELATYQKLFNSARKQNKGLFKMVKKF